MRISVVAVGTRGDVEPHMALCAGLRDRGHEVKLTAPVDFAEQAAELGLDFHPIQVSFRGLYDTRQGAVLQACGPRSFTFLRNLRRVAKTVAGQIFADIREACEGADAVCYTPLGIPAYYFAREMGIPSAISTLQPIGRTNSTPSPLVLSGWRLPGPLNRMTHVMVEQVFWQFLRPLIAARAKGGLPFWGHFNELYRNGGPMLFAFSPSVVPRPRDYQRNMHVTGFWTLPFRREWTPPPGLAEFMAKGSAPICIGFGSMNTARIGKMLDVTVRAVRQSGKRAVVLRGWSGARIDPAQLGDEIFVTDAVPHAWLFPRVAAVIHHGGAGTTAAALRAGIPSIVTPFFFDQWFWAQWLGRLRLGFEPIAFSSLTVSRMKSALENLENTSGLRERLNLVGAKLQREDGVGTAVAVLEEAWGGRS